MAKQHRKTFPKCATNRSKIAAAIFYVNLCEKIANPSIGGANNFILLTDGYSRYYFAHSLRNKTKVLINLKWYYAEINAQGYQINRFKSDNGLEFCNAEIDEFLLSNGIEHETSTLRALEQKDFIER